MADIFNSKEYLSSRNAYTLQCMFEYFVALLSADAFLAKLLKDIGLSDAATGVLSSLITVSFLFQLLSVPLAGKLKRIKKYIILVDTASQLLFAAVFTVPFMPLSFKGKAAAATALILLGYLALYLNNTLCYKWGNSFVSPDNRGTYSAIKEMVSLIAGVVFTLGAGYVVDRFELKGNLHGAFGFLSASMVVVCGFNFICLAKMKELPLAESGASQSIKEIIRHTFGNKNFRNVIILTSISEFARYLTIGFMGTYKTVDLGLSVSKIQIINVAACLARFLISKPLGKYSDRKGFANGYYIGNLMTLAAFLIGVFVSPERGWLILPFTIIYQMAMSGIGQNNYNMAYCYVDDEYILAGIAVNNSTKGVFGFAASFIGSLILDYVQSCGNTFMGIHANGQQVLSAITAFLMVFALIFNKKVVSKQAENRK